MRDDKPGVTWMRWTVDIPQDGWYTLTELGVPDDAEILLIDGVQIWPESNEG